MVLSLPSAEISNSVHPAKPDLPFYRKLGRTDLTVSCLGIGGGGGISSDDTLYAFDRGINFFFFSSDLHHATYSRMSKALRHLCQRGSSEREKVVLATATYIKSPEMSSTALYDQFYELGIDYVDAFFWGWVDARDRQNFNECMQLSANMRGPNTVYQAFLEKIFGVSERLKKMGAVRYVGASFHDLGLAQQWLNSSLLDVVMIRHNVAHRHAQKQVLNQFNAEDVNRPGIITFKSTGLHTGPALWLPPAGLPKTCWQPSVPDLYRYSLTQNCVDVCLTGVQSRDEIDAAIAGVKQGKLSASEVDYLNLYGDFHRGRIKPDEILLDRLLYRAR